MTTYTYIHSFMTLSQRFDPNHDTCVTRLVWRRRVPWGLVDLSTGVPRGVPVWTGGNRLTAAERARERERERERARERVRERERERERASERVSVLLL